MASFGMLGRVLITAEHIVVLFVDHHFQIKCLARTLCVKAAKAMIDRMRDRFTSGVITAGGIGV